MNLRLNKTFPVLSCLLRPKCNNLQVCKHIFSKESDVESPLVMLVPTRFPLFGLFWGEGCNWCRKLKLVGVQALLNF
jgi:hypothetical protein